MDGGRRQQRIEQAFSFLLDAHEYARDVGDDDWQFAVEIPRLAAIGLGDNEFRWLISKGYVEHAYEMTVPGDSKRVFRQVPAFRFNRRSCLALTKQGVGAARSVAVECADGQEQPAASDEPPAGSDLPQCAGGEKCPSCGVDGGRPVWDGERHELRFGQLIVKRFKRPSPNQEAILAAFEEESWPACIADPLSQDPDIDPKRRLNDTLKALNRNQKHPLLHFAGDGSGEGVIWERAKTNGR